MRGRTAFMARGGGCSVLAGLIACGSLQAQTGGAVAPASGSAVRPPASASRPASSAGPDTRPAGPVAPPPRDGRPTPPSPPVLPPQSPLNVFIPGVAPPAVPPPQAPLPPPGVPLAASPEATHEPGQLLVLWPSLQEAARGQAVLQQQYRILLRQRHVLDSLGMVLGLLVLPGDAEARTLRDRLRAEQPGWVVDLNARARSLQAASARLYAQRMLGIVAGARASGAAPLRVGVIDTGVSLALTQPQALNGSTLHLRSLLEPGDMPADPAHGNAVLQLIAGAEHPSSFAGAAPPLELFWAAGVRDVGGRAATNTLVVARGLDWLVAQRVAVVNLSFGGPGDAVLQAVVARVLASNIAIVAAAGNNPAPDAAPSYPAAYPGVWATTAVDAAGRLYGQATRASYALLAAPGVEVWIPAEGQGLYVSGTSFATALATAALAWQPKAFWALPGPERQQLVCAQARKLPQAEFVGCGLVQKPGAGSQP